MYVLGLHGTHREKLVNEFFFKPMWIIKNPNGFLMVCQVQVFLTKVQMNLLKPFLIFKAYVN